MCECGEGGSTPTIRGVSGLAGNRAGAVGGRCQRGATIGDRCGGLPDAVQHTRRPARQRFAGQGADARLLFHMITENRRQALFQLPDGERIVAVAMHFGEVFGPD